MTPRPTRYTNEFYRSLLKDIGDAGYSWMTVGTSTPWPTKPLMFLRHDVDISPRMAVKLAEIEVDEDVRSSFFFQLNAGTYNIFSEDVQGYIRAIIDMGHAVGLHIDQASIPEDEHKIKTTLDWFRSVIINVDPIVSFHRPTTSVLGRRFDSFTSAYDPSMFSRDRYVTDSRRNHDFYEKLSSLLAVRSSPLQLLLHPVWWSGLRDCAEIFDELEMRARSDLRRYVKRNFEKAMGDIAGEPARGFMV